MEVVFLESAETDLKELKSYVVKKFGNETWVEGFNEIKKSLASVADGTITGKIPLELLDLNDKRYRQVLTSMNKIIYQVIGNTVYVHIVCDQRRDFSTLLMQRLFRA